MKHSLYKHSLLFTALMLTVTACGQKGPLVAPPDAPQAEAQPAAADTPANDTLIDEADD